MCVVLQFLNQSDSKRLLLSGCSQMREALKEMDETIWTSSRKNEIVLQRPEMEVNDGEKQVAVSR